MIRTFLGSVGVAGFALCMTVGAAAQQPAPPPATPAPATPRAPAAQAPATPAAATAAAAAARLAITGDAGLVFFTVKAEGAGDFEAFFNKVKEALAQSAKPEHKSMAAGWRIFKVTEGAQAGQVLYASLMDPVVATADYDPVKILNELMPTEVTALYPKFKDAVLTVNRASLVNAIKMAP